MIISLAEQHVPLDRAVPEPAHRAGAKDLPTALTLGSAPSLDPDELVVHEEGNTFEAPAGVHAKGPLKVIAATINGKPS